MPSQTSKWPDPDRRVRMLGDLALFLGGSDDSFTGQLLRLMRKADPGNRSRLARVFPREHHALMLWDALDEPTFGQLEDHLALITARLDPGSTLES